MYKKLIITHYQTGILIALFENNEIVELQYEDEKEQSLLGNIYVGRVKQVVKNINAAFLSFGEEQTGYYSLTDNRNPYFLNQKKNNIPVQGDLILVQVSKEPIKTKDATLTSHINLTGKYAVLTVGNSQMSISSKIQDENWKVSCRLICRPYCTEEYGFIIRTNAYQIDLEEIIKEIKELSIQYAAIKKEAVYLTAHSLVYQSPVSYLKDLRNIYDENVAEFITDDINIYNQFENFLKDQPELLQKLVLYKDPLLPLINLYSLSTVVERALKSKVWLKSGGYLVIEPTEALTVIDVNTGKCVIKKNVEETRQIINKEAAKEIAKQLRIRNISGIIIVDFINMDSEQATNELMAYFSTELRKDPIRTYLAGITNLGLAEVTRKKSRKSFMEQMKPKL